MTTRQMDCPVCGSIAHNRASYRLDGELQYECDECGWNNELDPDLYYEEWQERLRINALYNEIYYGKTHRGGMRSHDRGMMA